MFVAELLEALEVARLREDHAAVHHGRLDDHAGDPAGVLLERATHFHEIVERHDPHEVGERLRDAERLRHRHRMLARPDLRTIGADAEHDGVVVTVIAPLDLDQHVPAGVRAHQTERFQRGFGSGVREAPERELEPVREVLPDHVKILGRLSEVRPPARGLLDRIHDQGVGVSRNHRAVAQMEIEVLVPVDVVDPVPLSVIDEDRVGTRILPAGGDAPGDEPLGDRAVGDGGSVLRLEGRFLLGDERIDPVQVEIDRSIRNHPARLLAGGTAIRGSARPI